MIRCLTGPVCSCGRARLYFKSAEAEGRLAEAVGLCSAGCYVAACGSGGLSWRAPGRLTARAPSAQPAAAAQVFDIMRPDASMSRRAPPPAALRLFLSAGRPPGWAEAGAADASAGGAPAVYASRSQGAYAFYLLRRVTLASLW
jgi:hypothetical protein